MGLGSLQERGEERAGLGIPMGARPGRNKKLILQHCAIVHNQGSHNRKSTQRREPLRKGAETGSTRYGMWES